MKKLLAIVSLVVLLAACSQQQVTENLEAQVANTWKPLGGALDVVTKNNAVAPKALLDRNGKLVVVWAEDNGLWYLQGKRWNGTAWEKLAFPSKPLPYTEEGVNPFDVVFDSSNSLVVSEKASSGTIRVFKNTGSSWTKLATPGHNYELTHVNLETDASGRIYGLAGDDKVSIYDIKRWNGSSWETTNSFNRIPQNTDRYYQVVDFLIKSNGGPVVITQADSYFYESIFIWTIKGWQMIASANDSSMFTRSSFTSYTLNANDLLFYAINSSSSRGFGYNKDTLFYSEISSTPPLGTFDQTHISILGFRNNSPILAARDNTKTTILQKINGTWKQFGNQLERDITKKAYPLGIITDKLGNTFILFQVGGCTIDGCFDGGGNIYVSQYVP